MFPNTMEEDIKVVSGMPIAWIFGYLSLMFMLSWYLDQLDYLIKKIEKKVKE